MAVSWPLIILVAYFVGIFPAAYLSARLMGDMGAGAFALAWPATRPVFVLIRLAELGADHS